MRRTDRTIDRDVLAESAQDLLEELRNETGETAALAVVDLKRLEGEVLVSLSGSQAFNFKAEVGYHFPLYCTGPGKAFLSALPERRLRRVIGALTLKPHTRSTHTDPEALLADLQASGRRGYAFDLEEVVDGLVCIGTPLVMEGAPVAAIWITFPLFRIDRSRYDALGLAVRRTADRIVRRLEGREYDPDRHVRWVVAQARDYLQEHVSEPVCMAALARRLHTGYCWFHRCFRKQVGASPKQYHTNLRIAKAARMLRCTQLTVQEIAARLGYPTPDYFSAAFKTKMRMSPQRYRRSPRPGEKSTAAAPRDRRKVPAKPRAAVRSG